MADNSRLSLNASALANLRADLHDFWQRELPIRIRLTYIGPNAAHDGVGDPPDANDVPWGQPMAFSFGFNERFAIYGDCHAISRLQALAERAGRLACQCSSGANCGRREHAYFWWTLVFDLACSGEHPTLRAKQQIWLKPARFNGRTVLLPRDLNELRALKQTMDDAVPPHWLDKLPDAFLSDIDNAALACRDYADAWLAKLNARGRPDQQKAGATRPHRRGRPADTDPKRDARIAADWRASDLPSYRDFANARGYAERDVKLAVGRHRKREQQQRSG